MLEVVFFVHYMSINSVLNVIFPIVSTKRQKEHKPADIIKMNGTNMFKNIKDKLHLVLAEFSNKKKHIHGNNQIQANKQPYNEEPAEELAKKNYFSPAQFYCMETICAPCGVVIA